MVYPGFDTAITEISNYDDFNLGGWYWWGSSQTGARNTRLNTAHGFFS